MKEHPKFASIKSIVSNIICRVHPCGVAIHEDVLNAHANRGADEVIAEMGEEETLLADSVKKIELLLAIGGDNGILNRNYLVLMNKINEIIEHINK